MFNNIPTAHLITSHFLSMKEKISFSQFRRTECLGLFRCLSPFASVHMSYLFQVSNDYSPLLWFSL